MKRHSVKVISAIIIFLLGLINLTVLSMFTYSQLKENINTRYDENSKLLLTLKMEHLNERLSESENVIRVITELPYLKNRYLNKNKIKQILDDGASLMHGAKNIFFASRDMFVTNSDKKIYQKGYDPTKREWYVNAVSRKKSISWSDPFFDYEDQHIIFSVSAPVYKRNGSVRGAVGATFEVSEISKFFSKDNLGKEGMIMLIGRNGKVLANRNHYFIGQKIFKDILFTGFNDNEIKNFNLRLNNRPYRVNIVKLSSNGMFLATALSETELENIFIKQFYDIFIVLFTFLLLFSIVAFFIARKGISPMNKLSNLMAEAENGNYSVRANFNYYKEISELSRHFNSMLDGIKSRDEILKHREVKIKNLAYYDSLTGLPNRTCLLNNINEVMSAYGEDENSGKVDGAIMYIDLDGFKIINDTMGHSTGDLVLKEVAARLKHNLRYGQLAARIGGDEFVVLLQNIESIDVVQKVGRRILELLNKPIVFDNLRYDVGASIGIVLYPFHGTDQDILLKKADMAMYKAKKNGRNNYQLFEENLEEEIIKRNLIEREIKRSLRENLFYVNYQPQYSFKTGEICAFEVLLRFKNEILKEFDLESVIEIAEETGMIVEIEKQVLEMSLKYIKEVNDRFISRIKLSVNISSTHVMQREFVDNIISAIEKHKVDHELIDLEITETIMMNSVDTCISKIDKLRNYKIGIHMDDFGTGYSSLSYLQNLPIDTVKIDKSFIKSMEEDRKKRNIIALIIEMAHNLDLKVVAEGIETEKQYDFLESFNCDIAQGYYLHKPASSESISKLLQELFSVGKSLAAD